MASASVVVLDKLVQHRWRGPAMSMRSAGSARAVRTNRSASAFIRGHCGAILTLSMPIDVDTASNASVNVASLSRIRCVNRFLVSSSCRVGSRASRMAPGGGGVFGDLERMRPAGADLDHERDVHPLERDRAVNV